MALFACAIIAGGWFIFPKALRAARRLSPDMNLLMTVAVIGAALIGEWSEAAAVTFLSGLSEYLEAASLARERRAIQGGHNVGVAQFEYPRKAGSEYPWGSSVPGCREIKHRRNW